MSDKKKKQTPARVFEHFQNLNQQNNIFIQNEIQSIANLCQTDKELACRMMTFLENGQEINKNNNDRIIAIEENEQKMRKTDMYFQRFLTMAGIIVFLFVFFVPLLLGAWLLYNGKEGGFLIGISFALVSPRIYKELKKS